MWKPKDRAIYVGKNKQLFGQEVMVVSVRDPKTSPGKHIAICSKTPFEGGHECDGLVPRGHGRWTTPDRLTTAENYKKVSEEIAKQRGVDRKEIEAAQLAASAFINEATEESK